MQEEVRAASEGMGMVIGDVAIVKSWGLSYLTPHLPISWGSSAAVKETN